MVPMTAYKIVLATFMRSATHAEFEAMFGRRLTRTQVEGLSLAHKLPPRGLCGVPDEIQAIARRAAILVRNTRCTPPVELAS